MRNNLRRGYIVSLVFFILVIIVACEPLLNQPGFLSGTETVFGNQVIQTITMRSIQQGNSGDALATALAGATAINLTSTAQAESNNASYKATATAILPVLEELPQYGVNPISGDVAWLHRPITISLNGYQQIGYANDYPQITAKDFVIAADINWNTQAGLSGCGFIFRSDGDAKSPSQLMVLLTRFSEGSMAFSAMDNGNVTNMQYYYPWTKDKSFNWQNNSTNRLVLVARKNLIDMYTNGIKIAEVDTSKPPPSSVNFPNIPTATAYPTPQLSSGYEQYQQDIDQINTQLQEAQRNYYSNKIPPLTDGFVGFVGSSSSGATVCKFSNAWLFLFHQPPTPTFTITPTFNGTEITDTPTPTPTLYFFYTPTPIPTNTFVRRTPTPYGAAFLWDDRFNDSQKNRNSSFEYLLYPISMILSVAVMTIWLWMIVRSSNRKIRRKINSLPNLFAKIIHPKSQES